MRVEQFGPLSVRTSQALEDVAYALYVHEYGTGNFQQARYLFLFLLKSFLSLSFFGFLVVFLREISARSHDL